MKKLFLLVFSSLSILLFFSSCKDEEPLNDLTVSVSSIGMPAAGGNYSIELTSSESWTATSSESWCAISPSSGTGNGTIVITALSNENTSGRTAVITINTGGVEKTISVIQAGRDAVVGTITMETSKSAVTLFVSSLSATIDWGDGSSNTYTGDTVECSHTYAATASHTITITGTEFYRFESYYNDLTSIDVSNNPALTELFCAGNAFTNFDVSENDELEVLYCTWNSLTQLDVSDNKKLRQLSAEFNGISSLNVTENTALEVLELRNNDLTSIDLSKNTALTALDISDNPYLTNIDLSNNPALLVLTVYIGSLTSLDVSHNPALVELNVQQISALSSLDVSHNTHLQRLTCEQTGITSLDLSNNPELVRLWCRSNSNLTSLNFCSTSTTLTNIVCGWNGLSSAALNTALTSLPTAPSSHAEKMIFWLYEDGSGLPYWEGRNDRTSDLYEIEMYDIYIGTSICDETIATNKAWTVSKS